MIVRPRIKSKYHIEDVPGDGIFLLSENERHILEGDGIVNLIPYLDGRRTWDELLLLLEKHIGREKLLAAFDVLIRNNHVEDADSSLPPQFQAFWSELGRSGVSARQLTASTTVHIVPVGKVDTTIFEISIDSFGFSRDSSAPPSIILAVTDDYQQPALAEINDYCLERQLPWLLVKPGGLISLVGPFMLPRADGLLEMPREPPEAQSGGRDLHPGQKERKAPFPTTRMHVPIAEAQAASVAVIQMVRWLATGSNPALESRIISIEVVSARQNIHAVTRRPQCEACGDPRSAHVGGRPVVIQSLGRHGGRRQWASIRGPGDDLPTLHASCVGVQRHRQGPLPVRMARGGAAEGVPGGPQLRPEE